MNETLTLSCSISCSERPCVFWYLDGEELDLDDSENVYSDGKCTLRLKNVDKSYEGVYECIIQSQQTEITSCCSVKASFCIPAISNLLNSVYWKKARLVQFLDGLFQFTLKSSLSRVVDIQLDSRSWLKRASF